MKYLLLEDQQRLFWEKDLKLFFIVLFTREFDLRNTDSSEIESKRNLLYGFFLSRGHHIYDSESLFFYLATYFFQFCIYNCLHVLLMDVCN